MTEDDLRLEQGTRLKTGRVDAGYRSAREAALANDWPESSYRAHENGTRTIGPDDAERYAKRFRALGAKISGRQIIYGDDAPRTISGVVTPTSIVVVRGRIGAGAEILPEFEQIPPDGLFDIEVDLPVEADAIAFEVEGDSMWPRYDPGDVIICGREGTDINQVVGWEAAVRTADGKRFLKRIRRGSKNGLFDLESHNASPIRDVKLEWVAEIDHVVRAGKWRRLDRAAQKRILARTSKRTATR